MAEIFEVLRVENNNFAPSIYIESVEYYGDEFIVRYSLNDLYNSWSNNTNVLNDVKLNISFNEQKYETSLINVKNTSEVKENTFYNFVRFANTTASNIDLIASCSGGGFVGNTTRESVKQNNVFTKAFFNYYNTTASFDYISKVKDLSIVNLTSSLENSSFNTQSNNQIVFLSDLNISYTPEKKALLGINVDIEKLLEKNSKLYNILKAYPRFKQEILNKSTIQIDKSYFLKKRNNKK